MQHIHKDTFNTLKERMKAKFPILLEGYLRDAKAYLVTIETNLSGENLAALIDSAHSLKSASGLLGVINVHGEAEKIEYAAKALQEEHAKTFHALHSIFADLQSAFSAVEEELNAELKKAKAA